MYRHSIEIIFECKCEQQVLKYMYMIKNKCYIYLYVVFDGDKKNNQQIILLSYEIYLTVFGTCY